MWDNKNLKMIVHPYGHTPAAVMVLLLLVCNYLCSDQWCIQWGGHCPFGLIFLPYFPLRRYMVARVTRLGLPLATSSIRLWFKCFKPQLNPCVLREFAAMPTGGAATAKE